MTFPTIPHMTAFRTVLFWGTIPPPPPPKILVLRKIVSDKSFRAKHLQHYNSRNSHGNGDTYNFFQNRFRLHPLPKKFGADPKHFNAYNFCMKHFLLNPIFTRVKVKIKNLLKRNLPTYVCRLCREEFFYIIFLSVYVCIFIYVNCGCCKFWRLLKYLADHYARMQENHVSDMFPRVSLHTIRRVFFSQCMFLSVVAVSLGKFAEIP